MQSRYWRAGSRTDVYAGGELSGQSYADWASWGSGNFNDADLTLIGWARGRAGALGLDTDISVQLTPANDYLVGGGA